MIFLVLLAPAGAFSTTPNDPSSAKRLLLDKIIKTTESLPRPQTSIARDRRRTEARLVDSLNNDPAAVANLWEFWITERGKANANTLRQADGYISERANWAKGEDLLRTLIMDEPEWVEPKNRLATLLYMKGMVHESATLCECILVQKPWHFGALSGIVLCYSRTQQVEREVYWRRRQLPDERLQDERKRWTTAHVTQIMS